MRASSRSVARGASSGNPAIDAAASACRNSRRSNCYLLIDRRRRVDEQRDDVAYLLLGQDPVIAEARHARARGERLRVVDLLPCVATRLVGVAAQLAEVIERRADRAVRKLLRRKLMTRVAVRTSRPLRIVGVLEALSALRDLLTGFPVADEIVVARVADRRQIRLLDALDDRRG